MPDKANHTFVQYSSYNCWSKDDSKLCEEANGNKTGDWMYFNKTCMTYEDFCGMNNYTSSGDHCVSANGTNVTVDGLHFNFKTPSEDFWNTNILGLNVTTAMSPFFIPTMDKFQNVIFGLYDVTILQVSGEPGHVVNTWSEWGDINLPLTAALALAWLIICLTLIKGSDA